MKLNAVQFHQLLTALNNAVAVLNQVKTRVLKGRELEEMKRLEEAVQLLELLVLTSKRKGQS